jgi:hypothetical protein
VVAATTLRSGATMKIPPQFDVNFLNPNLIVLHSARS